MQKRQRIFIATLSIFTILLTGSSIAVAWQRDQSIIVEVKPELELPLVINSPDKPGLWVTGDSVILGIRHELEGSYPIAIINARVGRQAPELLEVMLRDGPLASKSPVVFNLGNNNTLTSAQVNAVFEAVKNAPLRIVVNTAVPRPWREANNVLIDEIAAKYPNTYVVRWDQVSDGHPEYFAPDGVHLVPAGVRAYVAAISSYL
jgi:hypothetical protein